MEKFNYGEVLTEETLRLQEESPDDFREFSETGFQLEQIAGFIVKTRGMRTKKQEEESKKDPVLSVEDSKAQFQLVLS